MGLLGVVMAEWEQRGDTWTLDTDGGLRLEVWPAAWDAGYRWAVGLYYDGHWCWCRRTGDGSTTPEDARRAAEAAALVWADEVAAAVAPLRAHDAAGGGA